MSVVKAVQALLESNSSNPEDTLEILFLVHSSILSSLSYPFDYAEQDLEAEAEVSHTLDETSMA